LSTSESEVIMKKQNFIAMILCSLGGDGYTEASMLDVFASFPADN